MLYLLCIGFERITFLADKKQLEIKEAIIII